MDIMIDLETFGLGPSPAIVQIGACLFTPHGHTNYNQHPQYCFNRVIALQSSILLGGTVDEDTIKWWKSQNLEAQNAITDGTIVSIRQALIDLTEFMKIREIEHVWANGAADDIPWLAAAYKSAFQIAPPWRFNKVRDTRTLFWLAEYADWERPVMEGIAHSALDDAISQATHVTLATQHLLTRLDQKVDQLPTDLPPGGSY